MQQDFQLSLDKRDTVKELIGEYAEALVYAFCTMDLASLDATMNHAPGNCLLGNEEPLGMIVSLRPPPHPVYHLAYRTAPVPPHQITTSDPVSFKLPRVLCMCEMRGGGGKASATET